VANIEPGKQIDVEITYFHTLAYDDGWYEWVFPMVVGPRFNPPHISDGVGAVARGADGASGQATEVQYLAPSERSGHDVSILVEIDAGVEIGDIRCRSHTIEVMRDGASHATIRLAGESTIPNKDFVLRYDVASDDVQSAMVVSRDAATGEGYFSMLLVPPQTVSEANRRPMELVFVIDCSGSMSGEPIAQAKSAIERGLELLAPGDTFQIIRFSEGASALGTHPLEATPANIRSARSHVRALSGGGGTMMIEGIKAALDFPHDPERTRFVVFLTDGFIGNEHEILGEMRSRLDTSRVFSFGVGSAPNRFLIERMARLGRGAVAYLALEDSGAEVMEAFFERAARPALAHLAIDWGGAQVADVHPAELPDLYAGRPVVVTGRIAAFGDEPVRVSGDTPRGNVLIEVEESTADATDSLRAMRAVWARSRIADLLDEATFEPVADLPAQVRDLALSYELMSPYTAFVAVDSTRVTEGDHGISTVVPVHVPDGVRYDTTVQGGG
jgi:Ca-activated chloride channel family protein